MKHLITILLLMICAGISAQTGPIDTTFVVVARFQTFSTVNDSTFSGSAVVPSDQLGQNFNPTQVNVGDYAVDQLGRLFRISSISSSSRVSISFQCVEKQDDNIPPIGIGQIYREDPTGLIPIQASNNVGISDQLMARVINNNLIKSRRRIDTALTRTEIDTTGLDTDNTIVNTALREIAINEQANRRKFQNFDLFTNKKSILNLSGQEQLKVGELDVSVTPTPLPIVINSPAKDTAVDNLFLQTISVSYSGENRARLSQNFSDYGASGSEKGYLFTGAEIIKDFAIAPDMTRSVGALVGSGTFYCYINGNETDSVYTVSFYAKPQGDPSGLISWSNIRFNNNDAAFSNPTISIDTSRDDFYRYSATINRPTTTSEQYVVGTWTQAAGDTTLVWGFQVEEGSTVSTYKRTTWFTPATSGTMYYNLGRALIDGGTLDLRKLKQAPTLNSVDARVFDDGVFIQACIDYCDNGNRCNEIILDKRVYTTKRQINMAKRVKVRGAVQNRYTIGNPDRNLLGTVILSEIADPTKSVFNFEPASGDQIIEATGLEDLTIILKDTTNTVINVNEAQASTFKRLVIENDGVVGQHGNGLKVTVDVSSDQYWNEFRDINVDGSDTIAVLYQGSVDNDFENVNVINANVGLQIEGGVSDFNVATIQACSTAVKITGGRANIRQLYTENSGISAPVIYMTDGLLFIDLSTLQTPAAGDTLIRADDGDFIKISNSRINRSSTVIDINDNFSGFIDFEQVDSETDLRSIPWSEKIRKQVRVYHSKKRDSDVRYPDEYGSSVFLNSLATQSAVSNSHISDRITLSGTKLIGSNVNYIAYSDSLDVGSYDTGNVTVAASPVTDPYGGSGAKVIVYNTGTLSTSTTSYIDRGATAVTLGENYIFSIWMYNHESETKAFTPFLVRPAANGANDEELAVSLPPQKWVRVFTQGPVDFSDTSIRLRFTNKLGNIAAGDSISVFGMKLEEGDVMTGYISTGAAGISNTNIDTDIGLDGTGTWNITGNIDVSGSFQAGSVLDSDGDAGTAGQLFTATGSGTNWSSPSYGEAYIDYVDPDSVTVATAGTLYDFTDVLEGSSSSDVTVSTTTGRLTYTGTTEKLFEVIWTATVTSNANNENLIGTVMDNGATITRIRWEEEDTASGDTHSVAASGFFSMGQNDWVQPKLTAETNGTEVRVITMSFRIKEVR